MAYIACPSSLANAAFISHGFLHLERFNWLINNRKNHQVDVAQNKFKLHLEFSLCLTTFIGQNKKSLH
jgi:hypothetical protein